MQFFFGWIAGVLTAGVWFVIWWIEQNDGLPTIFATDPCICRSYHIRTGLHIEECPCYEEEDSYESRD